MAAESSFSYSISRRYPYPWLAPVSLIGGAILLAFFTWFNYVSSGYNLTVQYSTNPNITNQETWLGHWSEVLLGRGESSLCEPAIIEAGSSIMTTNQMFTYTVATITDANGAFLPSLAYSNNPLETCNMSSAMISSTFVGRSAAQVSASWWGLDLSSTISCFVKNGLSQPVVVNLTVDWSPWPATMTTYGSSKFLGRNATSRASLFWGESMLRYYAAETVYRIDRHTTQETAVEATFYPGDNRTIESLGYFNASLRASSFWQNDTNGAWDMKTWWQPNANGTSNTTWPVANMYTYDYYGDFWLSADALLKVFEATMKTDLSQKTWAPNLLTNATLLEHFTQNLTWSSNFTTRWRAADDLATAPFNPQNISHPLGVNDSTIAATYLCNVPRPKPGRELFQTILVADIVFLTALWRIFAFVMGYFVRRRDATANFCDGCMAAARRPSEPTQAWEGLTSRKSLASVRTRSTSDYELLEGHELHGDGWQRRS